MPFHAFHVGQRVRTTIDLLAGPLGGFSAPAGTLGTIGSLASPRCGYGVLLDGDPSGWEVVYDTFELAPA
jgi:hypothetical protein